MAEYIIQKAIDKKDMSARAIKGMAGKWFDIQPKYDGCHAVFVMIDGKFKSAMSATGEHVMSMDHIGLELETLMPRLPGAYAVCGEAWVPGLEFPEISGMFRRHRPQVDLKFAPFDVVEVNGTTLSSSKTYDFRKRFLETYFSETKGRGVLPFRSRPAGTDEENETYARTLKDMGGFDGAILHDLDATYEVGRCRQGEVVKIKPLLSYDLQVTGCDTDQGEKTGKNTAALIVRFRNNKYVKVATGLTQEQVDSIHSDFSGKWYGTIVEVQAMDVTKDGSLREPRFKGVRFDKDKPDF